MELENPENLTCPVCLEVMCDRDPVMLPTCGHSFCRLCLTKIASQPTCCPTCRTEHHGLSPQQLPTNYCVAYLTSSQLKVEDKISVHKKSFTLMKNPSAPPFSSATVNEQEIPLNTDSSFPEEPYIGTLYLSFQNTKSTELPEGKIMESTVFSCINILQLLMITLIILAFISIYACNILDWIFNITQVNYNSLEKLYLLIFGCFGLPKFIHLVYRFFKGSPSNFEISLIVNYFIFDIIWILVGSLFEVNLEVFLIVTIPSSIIMGFCILASALSVTTLPLTPEMKASTWCMRAVGYTNLGLSIVGFVSAFLLMIVLGTVNFTGYEQLYLQVAGASGIQTSLHGIYRLIKGKSFPYENYISLLYLLLHCTWFLVGVSGLIPISALIFWLSNAPALTIIVMSILMSSQSLNPALLYCCANTYNALV